MSLLARIKTTFFGLAPPPPSRTVKEDRDVVGAGIGRAEVSRRQNVSTPADDPVMDDVAAAGAEPLSKSVESEEAQDPERRPTTRPN